MNNIVMWYRIASSIRISEYWSDKKIREELFEIVAKSFKRRNANGDEDRLLEIENEDPGKNINIIKKIQIGNDIHSLLHGAHHRNITYRYTAHDVIMELLNEFCEKYFIDSIDKERIFQIIQQWIIEYQEYVNSLPI